MLRSRPLSFGNVTAHPSTAAVVAFVALTLSGCTQDEHQVTAPSNRASSLSLTGGQADLDSALAVHRRHTFRLIAIPGVVGTAVGLTTDGRPSIQIFTKQAGIAGLPASLEGIPVEIQVSGVLFAIPAQGRATASSCIGEPYSPFGCLNTDGWPLPVPTGVSTSSDAPASCGATGTIAARVKAGSAVYTLSNNHVLADENRVPVGTNVLQPGRYNTNCSSSGSNIIGTLVAFDTIAFCNGSCPDNTIDAAIASSDVAKLDNWTPPGGYGVPNSVVRAAALGLGVQKYGVTTSLTSGQVTGIDATVLVGYSTGCPNACSTARFVHQIVVGSCPTPCGRPGDSGSLWVTNDASKNPVGLLFAGNQDGSVSIANQIGDVLTHFGVSVDNSPAPTASGGLTAHGNPFPYPCSAGAITAVTASGSNAISLTDSCGNTGTITLLGGTASGGLTAHGNPNRMCSPGAIAAVTASGSNAINLKDSCQNTGTLALSGATASGGLTARGNPYPFMCSGGSITAATASGSKWISLTDSCNNGGYIRLSF
jgi:hypothetical protein